MVTSAPRARRLIKQVPDERSARRPTSWTSADACAALVRDALDTGDTDDITIVAGRTVRRD